ncbi:MAG: ABC transporter substrate-binding protein [Elusimicrobia bacterium]|nr:ABC transporter substrate-binding protein [Elusimicrobiota bacterium]
MKIFFVFFLLALPARAAEKRIISLLPSYTEILFALDAKQIVGVSNYCDFPPEALKTEKIGDLWHPNTEKIISLRPDVVIAGKWKSSPAVAALKRFNIKILEIPEAEKIEDIYTTISIIANETDTLPKARELIEEISYAVAEISAKAAVKKNKPRVYIEVDSPQWTAGKNSYLSDMVEKAGGINIFADIKQPYARVSLETIIFRKPDVIISLAKTTGIKIRRLKIAKLDPNIVARPGPRAAQALELIYNAIHGE